MIAYDLRNTIDINRFSCIFKQLKRDKSKQQTRTLGIECNPISARPLRQQLIFIPRFMHLFPCDKLNKTKITYI